VIEAGLGSMEVRLVPRGLGSLGPGVGAGCRSAEDEVLGLDGADGEGNPSSGSLCNRGWGASDTWACSVWRAL
jgi:hypothetical protein